MTTPRLGAPELTSAQALPEGTVNEQIRYLESAAGHFVIKDRDLAAPPGSPADGDTYLVAASPTGAWAGKAGKIAYFLNTAWIFITAIEGFTAWVNDEDVFIGLDGAGTWNVLASPSGVYVPLTYLDTDGTLAANSDTKVATQKAVKTAIAAAVTGLLDLKGTTDCSANPNYPAASKGDYYVVTVAGKIGGASGTTVAVGDVYFAVADNAGGTQASVGASWDVLVHASVAAGGGLLAANNLSDLASASTARTNLGLLRLIAFFFTTTPSASEVLAIYVAADAFTIPANWTGSQVKKGVGGVNPAATFAVDVEQNGATIGTISISTGGVVTLTTTSGTSKAIAAGDVLTFIGPATADSAILNWAFNMKGTL